MELKHDWKSLNEVLFPNQQENLKASSVALLEDDGKIVEGLVSNGKPFDGVEDFQSTKAGLDKVAKQYGVDKTIVFNKKEFDQFIIEASNLGTNYYQQLQNLRERLIEKKARPQKGLMLSSRNHFILDLFSGFLRWALPRRYNVLIFIDNRDSFTVSENEITTPGYRAVILNYNRGKLDQFYEPDFSSLHQRRLIDWHKEHEAIGQYLENRYLLPCYCLFWYADSWKQSSDAARKRFVSPWAYFVKNYDEGRAVLYPVGIITKAVLAVQRLIVYFSRL